jgi:hypothetical protein
MKPIREMTQAELGAFVQSHLRDNGINLVLSGGAAVSIYSSGRYVSLDLDMVNVYSVRFSLIRMAMQEIGFEERARCFKHPDSQFFVEFPPGPLTIGDEPVRQINSIELPTGTLKVISPTDSVKDRLAAYYHWGDRQSLEQAILVSEESDIDLDEIKRWSDKEGKLADFERIVDRLSSK